MPFERHKQKAIFKALLKKMPGINLIRSLRTRGSNESRYCYSVWLRHYIFLNSYGNFRPQQMAELGPGDSIGVSLAALLCGVEKIYAFDVNNTIDVNQNIKIFDDLVQMFNNREEIPSKNEYPYLSPAIENHEFPHDLINDSILEQSLNPSRIAEIREEIMQLNSSEFNGKYIFYKAPWDINNAELYGKIDLIISQAVLEHVLNLENTYKEMYNFLRIGGRMSHQIDFKCHGTSSYWNGHRFYRDKEWSFVNDVEGPAINRTTYLDHLKISENLGFTTKCTKLIKRDDGLAYEHFKDLFPESKITNDEFVTSGMFLISEKF